MAVTGIIGDSPRIVIVPTAHPNVSFSTLTATFNDVAIGDAAGRRHVFAFAFGREGSNDIEPTSLTMDGESMTRVDAGLSQDCFFYADAGTGSVHEGKTTSDFVATRASDAVTTPDTFSLQVFNVIGGKGPIQIGSPVTGFSGPSLDLSISVPVENRGGILVGYRGGVNGITHTLSGVTQYADDNVAAGFRCGSGYATFTADDATHGVTLTVPSASARLIQAIPIR